MNAVFNLLQPGTDLSWSFKNERWLTSFLILAFFLSFLQNFYLWKKDKKALKDIKDKDKGLLIQVNTNTCRGTSFAFRTWPLTFFVSVSPLQENFCGTSIIVPDLEGILHLKEDGKKSWKQRLFQLRASGIYYVPKGKTKVRGQSRHDEHT